MSNDTQTRLADALREARGLLDDDRTQCGDKDQRARVMPLIDAALTTCCGTAALNAEPATQLPGKPIFLVPSDQGDGSTQLYERHEGRPPPLCDYEGPLSPTPRTPEVDGLVDTSRMDWLDKHGGIIGIDHVGYGEYRYDAGEPFPPIRQVIDKARSNQNDYK